MCLGEIRIELEGTVCFRNRLIEASFPLKRGATDGVCLGESTIELEGTVFRNRLVEVPFSLNRGDSVQRGKSTTDGELCLRNRLIEAENAAKGASALNMSLNELGI